MLTKFIGFGQQLSARNVLRGRLRYYPDTAQPSCNRDFPVPEADMDLKALQAQFRGEILTAASADYEARRRIWNEMIDRRPAAIARCSGAADVGRLFGSL